MKSIVAIILGSITRHLITALLTTFFVTHRYLTTDEASAAANSVTDDWVFGIVAAVGSMLLPAALAIISRLRAKLKERLALLMPAKTTEHKVAATIAEAPIGARIAATLTADPKKIINT